MGILLHLRTKKILRLTTFSYKDMNWNGLGFETDLDQLSLRVNSKCYCYTFSLVVFSIVCELMFTHVILLVVSAMAGILVSVI